MEIAIFISLVVARFLGYFFDIFRSDHIFLVIQIHMTKVVGICKDCIFVFWDFYRYILVTRKNFHIPSFFLVCKNDNIPFC